jgi:hypothetical protein
VCTSQHGRACECLATSQCNCSETNPRPPMCMRNNGGGGGGGAGGSVLPLQARSCSHRGGTRVSLKGSAANCKCLRFPTQGPVLRCDRRLLPTPSPDNPEPHCCLCPRSRVPLHLRQHPCHAAGTLPGNGVGVGAPKHGGANAAAGIRLGRGPRGHLEAADLDGQLLQPAGARCEGGGRRGSAGGVLVTWGGQEGRAEAWRC